MAQGTRVTGDDSPGSVLGSLLAHPAIRLVLAVALFAPPLVNIAYSPDSLNYLAVARGLQDGLGFASRLLMPGSEVPRPLDLWPPSYPAAWALFLRLGLSPTAAATWVNATSLVVVLLCLPKLGPAGESTRRFWFSTLLLVAYIPFPDALRHAWSEPLSLALLAAGLVLDARGRTYAALALSGALLGLATLSRYPFGVVLLATQLPRWLAVARRREAGEAKWALSQIAGFTVVVAPWLVRNAQQFGRLLGYPNAPREHAAGVAAVMEGLESLALYGLLGWLGCAAVLWWVARARREGDHEAMRGVLPLALFAVLVFAATCISAYRLNIDRIYIRLLAPLTVTVVPLGAALLDALWERLTRDERRACIASAIIMATLPFVPSVYDATERRPALASVREAHAPVVAWMEAHVAPTDLVATPFDHFDLSAFCPGYFMSTYPEFPPLDAAALEHARRKPPLRGAKAFWLGAQVPTGVAHRLVAELPIQHGAQRLPVYELTPAANDDVAQSR